MRFVNLVVAAVIMLLAGGCSSTTDSAGGEPTTPPSSARSAPAVPSMEQEPSTSKPTPAPKQASNEDLPSVLLRKDDPDFGVEWSLSGPASIPGRSESQRPECESFNRTQYAPAGASGLVGENWTADSGKQTKHLTQVATAYPSVAAAQDFLGKYRRFVNSCDRYLAGGVDGDSFDTRLRPFKVKLVAGGEYVAWTTTTKLPDLPDVPDTYGSSVAIRRANAVVLVEYNTSDTQQPASVGRRWVSSYAKTVDERLDRKLK